MKKEYTSAELQKQLAALENLFDSACIVDPAARAVLDPVTLLPGKPCTAVPELDENGRGWQPSFRGERSTMEFYQAIRVEGRPCLLCVGYATPENQGAGRAGNAFSRLMRQYGEELHRDYVTGIYNRRYLDDVYLPRLREDLACGRRVSVVLVRVNEYADILTKHSSDAADRCLTMAAGILQIAAGMDSAKGVLVRLEDGLFLVTAMDRSGAELQKTLTTAAENSRREFSVSLSRRSTFTLSMAAADWAETGNWENLLSVAQLRLDQQ